MKLMAAVLFATLMSITAIGRANAEAIQSFSAAELSPGDSTFVDPDSYTVYSSSSVSFTTPDNLLTWSGNSVNEMYFSATAGDTYLGTAFPDGTQVFGATGDMGAVDGGVVTLTFANAIDEFGVSVEEYNLGPYTLQFTVYNGAKSLGTFSANGNDTWDSTGTLSFEGAAVAGGDVITSVVFDDSAAGGSNNLAFGPVTYSDAPSVPEPATFPLLGSGVAAFALFRSLRSAR